MMNEERMLKLEKEQTEYQKKQYETAKKAKSLKNRLKKSFQILFK